MNAVWALRCDREDAAATGALFGRGVEVLEAADALWLRGPAADEALARRLLRVPATGRFVVDSNGVLTPPGKQAPVGVLPSGQWTPLEHWLCLRSTVPLLPGALDTKASLRLIRVEQPTKNLLEPKGLLVSFSAWSNYANHASEIRLAPLTFAADDSRALILGKPLPPLPGTRLTVADNVAVPLGWTWTPALAPKDLLHLLDVVEDAVALWLPGAPVEIIPRRAFVAASRSAVRLTAEDGDG